MYVCKCGVTCSRECSCLGLAALQRTEREKGRHQFRLGKMILLATLLQLITIVHGAEDLPQGHLQPFGHHRPPDVVIDELSDLPDPQTFWDEYVSIEKAAIFRGAATRSPGFTLWTEEYLSKVYGDVEVRLEGKHERKSGIPVGEKGLGRDTVRNFLQTFREKDTYIVSQLPEPMYQDFYIPPSISCGNMRNRIIEIDLWMSSGNTHSIIHKDAFNAINCLMKGTKYWKLIEFKYEKWLYKTWEPKREIGGNSQVDAQSIDLLKYPDIAKVRWSNITINAGDCLFLPKSYYHQVSSTGDPNMAVSVLFSRLTQFDDTGCDQTPIDFTPLSEVDVLWSWPGHGIMSMGNLDIWMLKANYMEFAEEYGTMTEEIMRIDVMTTFPELEEDEVSRAVHEAWNVIDKSGKGFLTTDDINDLDVDTWREHCIRMTGHEPSNTEEFEYHYFDVGLIEELLDRLMDINPEKITRSMFVKNYIGALGGTEKYADEIFNGLAGESSASATPEQVRANMDMALKKWKENAPVDSTPEIDDSFEMNDVHLLKEEL
ncbi:uncharacterized protein LOC121427477 isoform X2 [Lytechinus variegatus]|uniref:uncharacterized protein LOC121427477 isoform X2 n=1 Tax=Lytechinus variegatus TaxID=7654 RepID=UPI001BB0DC03|nr:uncharacterized protein LOC121427477 isoform X2 [Lytechinus variegatus]